MVDDATQVDDAGHITLEVGGEPDGDGNIETVAGMSRNEAIASRVESGGVALLANVVRGGVRRILATRVR